MWLSLGLIWSWFPFFGSSVTPPPPAPTPPISHSHEVEVTVETPLANLQKEWTFLVYAVGDNDLSDFALLDVKEMEKVGSNDLINIVVYLDQDGASNYTKYLYVKKGFSDQVKIYNEKLDGGNPDTLVNFFNWATENYPAKHYALVFWNHGSGILDPVRTPARYRNLFFRIDPQTKMYTVNRSIGFIDFFRSLQNEDKNIRGVCFSDTYGSYLTNQKMQYALRKITSETLKKKIDIVAFDACLMAMIEVADIVKYYAHYMVASEETEMGNGWLYSTVLEPFNRKTLTEIEFAQHMVTSYEAEYINISNEYTHSALILNRIDALKKNVNKVASLLIEGLKNQQNYSVKAAINVSRSPRMCTHYAEPTYIDLYDFYDNLLNMIRYMRFLQGYESLANELQNALIEGKELISHAVLINTAGAALSKSRGVSIYFPTKYVDNSYTKTLFSKETLWGEFIKLMV